LGINAARTGKNNAEISVVRVSGDQPDQQIRRVVELPLKQLNSQDLEGDFMSQLILAGPPASNTR
jgi:hypothetical protein